MTPIWMTKSKCTYYELDSDQIPLSPLYSFIPHPLSLMEEEFLESDVIPEQNLVIVEDEVVSQGRLNSWNSRTSKNPTIPINIPKPVTGNSFIQSVETNFVDHDGELMPPHVILARRIFDRKMAPSSVLTGKGRTLKGRDLCQFRNSVLEMTGFLDENVTPRQFVRK